MDGRRSWVVEAGILKCGQVGATEGLRPRLATEWSDQEEAWPHPLNPALRIWGVSFQIEFTPEQIEGEWLGGGCVLSPGATGLGPGFPG